MLAAMTGSVTSAVALMGLHRLKGLPASAIVVHFSAVSTAIVAGGLGVQSYWSGAGVFAEAPATLAAGGLLLGVGVAATTGQLLLTRAFSSGAPARVSVVGLSQVVFAMLLEMSLWGRRPGIWSVAGMFLVTLPTAWLILRRAPSQPASTSSDV
jgi:drug/metabolite transporter (DMT)-like permease